MKQLAAQDRVVALTLATAAGFVDAIAFILSKGFFVSFMSGNSTRLGVGLVGNFQAALSAAALILAFVCGVALATRWRRNAYGSARSSLLVVIAAIVAIAAMLAIAGWASVALGCLALAMGMTNIVLADDGTVKVGLTYMTGALVRIGEAFGEGLPEKALPNVMLWFALAGGCAAGALLFQVCGAASLFLASGLLATVALYSNRRPEPF